MILKMLIRRRIVLVLFILIPAVFFAIVDLTSSNRILPFRLASLKPEVFIEVVEKDISFYFFQLLSLDFWLLFWL